MKIPLVRSANSVWQQPRPRITNRRTVRSTAAFVFLPALLLAAPLGNVYAGSDSTIYSFGMKQPLDGAVPKGSLTYVNGLLFGRTTTITCGAGSGDGVIFHFDPSNVTATYSIDHVFTGNPDGENPRHDAMTPFNGQLFGTTLQGGGTNNPGIIFSIVQNGSCYTALTDLAQQTGDAPTAALSWATIWATIFSTA